MYPKLEFKKEHIQGMPLGIWHHVACKYVSSISQVVRETIREHFVGPTYADGEVLRFDKNAISKL